MPSVTRLCPIILRRVLKDQNDQGFFALVVPVRIDDVLLPILHGALGSIDHLSRKRALPDPHDFEFVGCF